MSISSQEVRKISFRSLLGRKAGEKEREADGWSIRQHHISCGAVIYTAFTLESNQHMHTYFKKIKILEDTS